MSKFISRRDFGLFAGGATAALSLPGAALAQARTVTALGHRVHQTSATTGPGGDATEGFRKQADATVNWVTFGDVNAIHERLLREVSLGETTIDVAYLLNGRAVPRNLKLFEPLDALMKAAPIEAVDDFAPGLIAPMRLDGALHAIPVRHATNALIYNEAILEERGVSKLPTSFEELAELARKLTFKRDDGTQVNGLAFTAVFASNFLTLARCLGGDYMTPDGKLVANEPPMIKALALLADFYKAGVLPRNFATVNNEEITTWMQQGRAAMTINPFARLVTYNDPSKGKYGGRFKSLLPPMASDLAGKVAYAPTVEFWSLVIPKNAKQKPLGWELIRALSSKAGTLAMALNGNGPTRISTYSDEKLKAAMPYAADEAAALKASRIHLPAFDEQARAHDIFIEETQAAVLGRKPPQQAMDDAVARVKPLLG
ncbi:MAG TPA: extracellular solute-binding protein [Bosea sp. (in: a-proteobacteria)]|jgi:multiple sugar transport system substrate-binding protein|uniref:ABC transporter substrate-binding protein n=1 Tax=Bosea sp. (in: a-proteobacteria) TaxID=1871050 RepID=UPI002E10CF22|nr:extracellular solute-binding protein [Bosea sp. (in: a-proteobacteria)]